MDENCIFCKIISGKVPSFKIYENDDYLAFLDISQFTYGHTLVIPKKHTQFLWEVEDISNYMLLVQKIGKHFKSKGYKYVDIMVFCRRVPHVHIHLIPHNGDSEDYNESTSGIGKLQSDSSRHPTKEIGDKIVSDLKYEE